MLLEGENVLFDFGEAAGPYLKLSVSLRLRITKSHTHHSDHLIQHLLLMLLCASPYDPTPSNCIGEKDSEVPSPSLNFS